MIEIYKLKFNKIKNNKKLEKLRKKIKLIF